MTHLSLRSWSYQFHVPKVVAKIRQTISGRIAAGQCICVYDDNAGGLSPEAKAEIMRDWPQDKVLFSNSHPSAGTPLSAVSRRTSLNRRRRL